MHDPLQPLSITSERRCLFASLLGYEIRATRRKAKGPPLPSYGGPSGAPRRGTPELGIVRHSADNSIQWPTNLVCEVAHTLPSNFVNGLGLCAAPRG